MGFLPSGSEWLIILVIVLIIFGGSRLPGLFKALGQGVKEFRDASKDDSAEAEKPAPAPAAPAPEAPKSDDEPAA